MKVSKNIYINQTFSHSLCKLNPVTPHAFGGPIYMVQKGLFYTGLQDECPYFSVSFNMQNFVRILSSTDTQEKILASLFFRFFMQITYSTPFNIMSVSEWTKIKGVQISRLIWLDQK